MSAASFSGTQIEGSGGVEPGQPEHEDPCPTPTLLLGEAGVSSFVDASVPLTISEERQPEFDGKCQRRLSLDSFRGFALNIEPSADEEFVRASLVKAYESVKFERVYATSEMHRAGFSTIGKNGSALVELICNLLSLVRTVADATPKKEMSKRAFDSSEEEEDSEDMKSSTLPITDGMAHDSADDSGVAVGGIVTVELRFLKMKKNEEELGEADFEHIAVADSIVPTPGGDCWDLESLMKTATACDSADASDMAVLAMTHSMFGTFVLPMDCIQLTEAEQLRLENEELKERLQSKDADILELKQRLQQALSRASSVSSAAMEDTKTVACKCGIAMEFVDIKKAYPMRLTTPYCDLCGRWSEVGTLMWHCPKGKSFSHLTGWDVCAACAKT